MLDTGRWILDSLLPMFSVAQIQHPGSRIKYQESRNQHPIFFGSALSLLDFLDKNNANNKSQFGQMLRALPTSGPLPHHHSAVGFWILEPTTASSSLYQNSLTLLYFLAYITRI